MNTIKQQKINKQTNTLYKLGEHLRSHIFYGDVKSFPLLVKTTRDFNNKSLNKA